MKTIFTLLSISLYSIGLAQIEGNYYLQGYSVNGNFISTPVNDELPFVVTEFGSEEDGGTFYFKKTTICGMRNYEVEYLNNFQLKIIELAGMDNSVCEMPENQNFQSAYFNLFPNNSVFDIAYIDSEGGAEIDLSRATENGEYVVITYSTDMNTNDQYNPVQNLEWEHWYQSPNNYFGLSWSQPAQPHAVLTGYNIYRENELFRFQQGTALYYFPEGSNVDSDFLLYPEDNPGPFNISVTAVYEGGIESVAQSVWVEGMAMGTEEMKEEMVSAFPNPTKDILHFSEPLKEISVYDLSGKLIKTQKDLSGKLNVNDLPKGIYILSGVDKSGNKFNQKFMKL